MQKLGLQTLLLFCCSLFMLCSFSHGNQAENLYRLLKSRRSPNGRPAPDSWRDTDVQVHSLLNTAPQDGSMQADKIQKLPGQPFDGEFNQYSGYVSVDQHNGKSLFYYFVESPENPSTKPLLLWLNGGPGCSSLGVGAMQELGPFGVKSDGKTLYRNKYAWNNVANVLFLESPVGVGFSYSNTTPDYNNNGDIQTSKDSYVFLVNWLERFPSYRNREFYITGESYAGHYVPQLAYTILENNKNANQAIINLKGIAIGNALIDSSTADEGRFDFLWTHALFSDETYEGIKKYCDFENQNILEQCSSYLSDAEQETGLLYIYNIYAQTFCHQPLFRNGSISNETTYGPCSDTYVEAYLNMAEVQTALHAKPTEWSACRSLPEWNDSPDTILPILQNLFSSNISVWIYSGDIDSVIPVTASRYAINKLKLPVETPWRAWYTKNEVGGYVEGYKGLTFVTVRGSGHMVPSDQPRRALAMISAFLQGKHPYSSSS